MNSPNLYQKARKAQTEDASQFLEEFFPKLNWRPDGHDSLIDIGSGTGDLLYDLVHSRMPQSVERIVCSDINPNMIKFAQETYGTESKWEFQILDIENKEGFVEDFRGTFDHLTSFYVLHWTKSLRQAFQNIYDLLRPGNGDCIILFPINWFKIYDFYDTLRKSNKWSKYIPNMDRLATPLHGSKNPLNDLNNILTQVGFSKFEVDVRDRVVTYDKAEIFLENMEAISPYIQDIPSELLQQYREDFVETAISLDCYNRENGSFFIIYKSAVIYAKK